MQYTHPPPATANRREHILRYKHGSHRHSTGQYAHHVPVVQVLATFRTCTRKAAARELPLGVFLYAYILRQGG